MMQLVHSKIQKKFIINHEKTYDIVIENPKEYFLLVSDLKRQIDTHSDNPWFLSMNESILDLSKYCVMITDFFDIDFFDKKINNLLYKKITKSCQTMNIIDEINGLNTEICKLIEKIKENFDISIDYDDEIDLLSLLKVINTRISIQSTNFIELFISWIKVLIDLLGIEIIWTVDLKSFLSKEEYALLQKELVLLRITLINIESRKKYDLIDNEETIIIDNDLCEIHQ